MFCQVKFSQVFNPQEKSEQSVQIFSIRPEDLLHSRLIEGKITAKAEISRKEGLLSEVYYRDMKQKMLQKCKHCHLQYLKLGFASSLNYRSSLVTKAWDNSLAKHTAYF